MQTNGGASERCREIIIRKGTDDLPVVSVNGEDRGKSAVIFLTVNADGVAAMTVAGEPRVLAVLLGDALDRAPLLRAAAALQAMGALQRLRGAIDEPCNDPDCPVHGRAQKSSDGEAPAVPAARTSGVAPSGVLYL